MFDGFGALQTVDLTNLGTAFAGSMEGMFANCTSLENVTFNSKSAADVNYSFRVTASESFKGMFQNCTSLRSLDLTNAFVVGGTTAASYTTMESMFEGCTNLSSITAAIDQGSTSAFNGSTLTSLKALFKDCVSLESIDLSMLRFQNVNDVSQMFMNCERLAAITWNQTANYSLMSVTDMSYMFYNCAAYTNFDLHTFTSGLVNNTSYMFYGCASMTAIDVSYLNVAMVDTMQGMFAYCSNLGTIDLWTWALKSGVNIDEMFDNDTSLASIYVGEGFFADQSASQPNAAPANFTFRGCVSIKGADGTPYQDSAAYPGSTEYAKVGNTGYLCAKNLSCDTVYWSLGGDGELLLAARADGLGTLRPFGDGSDPTLVPWHGCAANIESFRVKEGDTIMGAFGETFANFFNGCTSLTDCDLTGMDFTGISSLRNMFKDCSSLETIDLGGRDVVTYSVTSMESMFDGCTSLKNVLGTDRIDFSTSGVASFVRMFADCKALEQIDLNGYAFTSAEDMTGMFAGCSRLKGVNLDNPRDGQYGVPALRTMNNMFDGCTSITDIRFPSEFNATSLESASYAFNGCEALQTADISMWNLPQIKTLDNLFQGCTHLTQVTWPSAETTGYSYVNTSALQATPTRTLANINGMFGGCDNLANISLNAIDVTGITENMQGVFANCGSLVEVDLSGWTLNSSSTGVVNTSRFFDSCSSLTTVFVGDGWVDTYIMASNDMFAKCMNIKGADGTTYQGSNTDVAGSTVYAHVGNTGYLCAKRVTGSVYWSLDGAGHLELEPMDRDSNVGFVGSFAALDADATDAQIAASIPWYTSRANIRSFGVAEGTTVAIPDHGTANSMFRGCNVLTDCDLTGLDTAGCEDMSNMFSGCSSLVNLTTAGIYTPEVLKMNHMFFGCSSLGTVDVGTFRTDKLQEMSHMFDGCTALEYIDMRYMTTPQVRLMDYMFNGCSSLRIMSIASFETPNVTTMSHMFNGCSAL